jgi:8-oxo-dGTP pyrophosphatase MutT (NUDIX family)
MAIDPQPSPPLPPAATLILVREHAGELQTYLLRRSPNSRFMPGLFVFPGGLVEPVDGDEGFWNGRVDVSPAALGPRPGGDLECSLALRYAVAAIRETFEEAGILFAATAGAGSAALKRAEERRRRERLPPDWLKHEVAAEGWTLTVSALWPWSHWITPVGMLRRFDTRFFIAVLPEGQNGRPDLRETTEGRWIGARQALAQNLDGRTPLSPPTLVTLHELAGYASLEHLEQGLPQRGWGEPIFPRLVALDNGRGAVIIEPWDPMYDQTDLRIGADKLSECRLPVGAPFSRLWNDGGVWKPVDATCSAESKGHRA